MFSLYRVIDTAYNFQSQKATDKKNAYCLVNIGKDISIINMVIGNQLKFPRFSNISIKTFVDYISKKTNKSYSDIEKVLDDFDFDQSLDMQFDRNLEPGMGGDTETSVSKDDHDITLNTAIKEASSQFINEITRSIDYFLNRYSTYNIRKNYNQWRYF
ncbi:MAG: hypothetical protein U5N58_09640 [Actinomycetota bacterium]|nr:hypothetical protein [Actinomycetota bacterium]